MSLISTQNVLQARQKVSYYFEKNELGISVSFKHLIGVVEYVPEDTHYLSEQFSDHSTRKPPLQILWVRYCFQNQKSVTGR